MSGFLVGICLVWAGFSVILTFVVGGMALFTPFLPFLAGWLKSMTVYDLATSPPVFVYAMLMALTPIAFGLYAYINYAASRGEWGSNKPGMFENTLMLLGTLITFLLIVGIGKLSVS